MDDRAVAWSGLEDVIAREVSWAQKKFGTEEYSEAAAWYAGYIRGLKWVVEQMEARS